MGDGGTGTISPNHAMEFSEFMGRTITLFHRVDSRIPQRISLKMLPMRHAGLINFPDFFQVEQVYKTSSLLPHRNPRILL